MAIRAAGTHQFVYRKMLEGPVGRRRHPTTATWCAWSTATACSSVIALWNGRSQISLRFLSRQDRAAGARVLARPH